jgi:hypothetical protein
MIAGSGSGRRNNDDEAATIAAVIFTRTIDTTKRREFAVDPLQILGLSNFDETDDCDSEELDDYGSE